MSNHESRGKPKLELLVCTLLHNLGFSFQKARFVSDHLDTAKRLTWLEQKWPTILRAAKRRRGLILFEDEASFAQWGSLSSTWARRGQQPEVPTSGKRKGKVSTNTVPPIIKTSTFQKNLV